MVSSVRLPSTGKHSSFLRTHSLANGLIHSGRQGSCQDVAECPLVLRLPSCRSVTSWRNILWTLSWLRWWWPLRSSGGTARA